MRLEEALWRNEAEYLQVVGYAKVFEAVLRRRDDWKPCVEQLLGEECQGIHRVLSCVRSALPVMARVALPELADA